MSREMATRLVNFILIICVFDCFSCLDGKQPDPRNHTQEWQDLISFVYQKIEGMERLLSEKDVIIGKLVKRVSDLETIVMLNPISENPETRHRAMSNTDMPVSNNDFARQIRPSINNTTIQRESVRSRSTRNKPHENQLHKKTTPFSRFRMAKTVDSKRRTFEASSTNSYYIPPTSQHFTGKDQPTYQADKNEDSVNLPKAQFPQSRVAPSSPRRAVAFHAEFSKNKVFSDNEIIAYDQEKLDQGGGYNPGVGLYIVPESGTYVITWTAVCYAHSAFQTVLVVNGAIRGLSWTDAEEINDDHQTTAIVVLTLNQGDRVFVRMGRTYGRGVIVSDSTAAWSTFSGWKID
ncbi:uncharacterized protein LOC110452606 [Mizuhopecten yessoensis]|uniref:uncharacterized protein LOC110452606 n=1 Tax=Mizuhopecten yessoensis TaxID=6573 RepID=UPI000B4579EF|nr:uncharacterized protein LOC110452606 [Mizuhopecten yessoensis]